MSVKVKSIIISVALLVVFAGIGIGLYCAWPAITGTITDSKYYTSEDLQDAYDKGFDDAFKNKDELTQQVDYYKELTDTYYISILDYQAQIKDYETLNANNQTTISNLENDKSELETTVSNLQNTVVENSATISENNLLISSLQSQVASLTASGEDNEREIANLESQISNLQTLNSQLQSTNESNLDTITLLNNQIVSLNAQIVDLANQVQNNSGTVSSLTAKIAQLEESIAYYEQYIAQLESGDQVVATFEFDGSVYNIQVLNKNGIASVTDPTSTDYVIFNGWTVDGEPVELSTYTISTNTKFVADVTYRYDVKFMVDGVIHNSQIVTSGAYATLPQEPTKDGYDFDYWTTDGVIQVDPTTVAITQNTTFVAKFTQLFTVKFIVEDDVVSTQSVRSGEYATNIDVEDFADKIFSCWLVNDIEVELSTYKIYADTVFVAEFSIKQFTTKVWYGFNDFDGKDVWTAGGNIYYSEGNFGLQYILDIETSTWEPIQWHGVGAFWGSDIWTNGTNTYYSYAGDNYIVNIETLTFEEISWNGLTSINGSDIWNYDGKTYYSTNSGLQYVLNTETSTWENKVWNGLSEFGLNSAMFSGNSIWIDGENVYGTLSNFLSTYNFKIDFETSTLIPVLWDNDVVIDGNGVWSDGDTIYCTYNEIMTYYSYVYNAETLMWEEKVWNNISNIDASCVWSDGIYTYYSYGLEQYVLGLYTI